jgi:hypothetical protein
MNYVLKAEPARIHLTPFGFLRYARHFLTAAQALPADPKFSPVPYYLLCHSIELALKAFVMASGKPLDFVKNQLGHDLQKALKAANDLGLAAVAAVPPDEEAEIDKAHEYYNVKAKGFEYFNIEPAVTGYPDLPSLPVLEMVAERLVRKLEPVCLAAANA